MGMAKQCELCELPASMHCESDRASLCWECDARVHGANFLVARHSRRLLCRSCQSPTPWRAAGARLGPTFSLCELCLGAGAGAGAGAGDGGGGGCGVVEKGERDSSGDNMGRDDEEAQLLYLSMLLPRLKHLYLLLLSSTPAWSISTG